MKGMLSGFGGFTLATGLIGLGLVAAAPARAADDGYANVFSSIFSAVGIVKPDPPPDISYRERPPLVLPPQPGLPKPEESVKHAAAWPKDPDVARHRKEADEARAPQTLTLNDKGEMVPAAELAKGRGESQPGAPNGCNVNSNNRNCLVVSPDELKAEGDRYNADNPDSGKSGEVVAGQEPDRVYLTQPPKGYMKATRTVKATTEAPLERIDPASPRSFTAPPKTDE